LRLDPQHGQHPPWRLALLRENRLGCRASPHWRQMPHARCAEERVAPRPRDGGKQNEGPGEHSGYDSAAAGLLQGQRERG
jgi:hypothetical protein